MDEDDFEILFPMHRAIISSRSPVNALEVLLNKCYTTPACYKRPWHRCYTAETSASNVSNEVSDIAVLGGGITGLASAYFLTRQLPEARITLFESTPRLGGWLRSKKVEVGHGNVLFEQGPRNLRPSTPNGLVTLDLVCLKTCTYSFVLIKRTRSVNLDSRIEFL